MATAYYLLDTFTEEKFKGNPTPVCLTHGELSVHTMQALAKEFNLPVTVFVAPKNIQGVYKIRYFTVTGEIPACGHATLGAAFVLFDTNHNNGLIFETAERIRLHARKDNELVFIEYPKLDSAVMEIPAGLINALGIHNVVSHFYCEALQSLFIELKTEKEVNELLPDFRLLTKSSQLLKEVVVFSEGGNMSYDYVLRSFCPWIGVDEDPVTGSVHAVLAHYWQQRSGKNELVAYQSSQRGGKIYVRPLHNRVEIGGHSRLIVKGILK